MNASICRVTTLGLAAALLSGCAGAGSGKVVAPLSRAIGGNGDVAASSSNRLMVVSGHSEPGRSAQLFVRCSPDPEFDCNPQPGDPPTPRPTPTPATQDMTFSITVPARTSNPKPRAKARSAQSNRHTSYVSQGTNSFTLSITPAQFGAPQSVVGPCVPNSDNTSTCTVQVTLQPGQNITVAASIWDGANGAGNTLAAGSTTAYIQAGAANNITIYLDPYIAEVDFFLNDPATGAPGQASITLHANATSPIAGTIVVYDVDGYAVPDASAAVNYRDPSGNIIAIAPSVSGSGSASVSPTSFAGHASGTTFSGSASGGSGASATLTPVIGSESGLCTANPIPPVCVVPADISFQ